MSFKVIASQVESRLIIIERDAFNYTEDHRLLKLSFYFPTAIFSTALGLEPQMHWLNFIN